MKERISASTYISWDDMFQSPRGDFGFLKALLKSRNRLRCCFKTFQSPRGDFGFLKARQTAFDKYLKGTVSIPSRGFWFFEGASGPSASRTRRNWFQSPRGDFGFLKGSRSRGCRATSGAVSIPSRGFWFFEDDLDYELVWYTAADEFQSPRGDFGFLKGVRSPLRGLLALTPSPSTGAGSRANRTSVQNPALKGRAIGVRSPLRGLLALTPSPSPTGAGSRANRTSVQNPALKGRARGTKPAARAAGPHPQPLSHWRGRGERRVKR